MENSEKTVILTPELFEHTIANPIVYSMFDSDLSGEALPFAQERYMERWSPEGFATRSKTIETLSPVVHDEVQRLLQQGENFDAWKKVNIPPNFGYTLLYENVDPDALKELFGTISPEIISGIRGNLEKNGVIVNPDFVKQALMRRYVEDSSALAKVQAQAGIFGEISSLGYNFIIGAVRDSVNFVTDIGIGEIGAAAGVGAAAGLTASPAGSIVGSLVGAGVALAAKHTAMINTFTNQRREELGLPKIPLVETFRNDVLYNTAFGAGLTGIFAVAGAIPKGIARFKNRTMPERTVATIQDFQERYKNSSMTDEEIKNILTNKSLSSAGMNIKQVSDLAAIVDFPQISDPSVRSDARAFNNSIAAVMADTPFVDDLGNIFAEKLSGYVGKMSDSELLLMSESMAKARTYSEAYNMMLRGLKHAEKKEDFVKTMRDMLFDEETKTLKQYYEKKYGTVLKSDAETRQNSIGYLALQKNIAQIIERSEFEGKLESENFLHDLPEFSSENPHARAAKTSETSRNLAFDWERLKKEVTSYIGDIKRKMSPTTLFLGLQERLNTYSATLNEFRSRYTWEFYGNLEGISTQELLSAWNPNVKDVTSRASAAKKTLDTVKLEQRRIADEYGISYGEIEDHVPQKWAQEKVAAVPLQEFTDDMFNALDLEKTVQAYRVPLKESLFKSEKTLEAEKLKFEQIGKRKIAKQQAILNTLKKYEPRVTSVLENIKNQAFKLTDARVDVLKKLTILDAKQKASENTLTELKNSLKSLGIRDSEISETENEIVAIKRDLVAFRKFERQALNRLTDVKKNIENADKIANQHANLTTALKLLTSFQKRNTALQVMRLSDSWKYVSSAEKTNLRVMYNFFKNLKLVPERKNNFADLTESDFSSMQRAALRLPEKLTEARAALKKLRENAAAVRYVDAVFKRVEHEGAAREQIVDRLNAALKIKEKKYIEEGARQLAVVATKFRKDLKTLKAKQEKVISVETSLKSLKDIQKTLKGLRSAEKREWKKKIGKASVVFTPELKERLRSLKDSPYVSEFQNLEKKFSQALINFAVKFDKKTKFLEEFSLNLKTKAEENIEKIQNRTYTAPIVRTAERINTLKNELQRPFAPSDLEQIYDNIVTEDLLEPSTEAIHPSLHKKRRILYFTDMNQFENINEKYGVMPDFRMLVAQDFESTLRTIARLRTFEGSRQFFENKFASDLRLVLGNRELGMFEDNFKQMLDANIDYVSGRISKKMTYSRALGRAYLSWVRLSSLGGSALPTFFEDSHSVAFSASQNGFGFWRTAANYVKGVTDLNLSRNEAARLLVTLDDVAADFEDINHRFASQKKTEGLLSAADKIDKFTFKANGVQWLTDRGRILFNRFFLRELGAFSENENPKLEKTLKNYGFGETDFAVLKKLDTDANGIPVFTDFFKTTKTYKKLLRALYSENRIAVATTSQSLKATLAADKGVLGAFGIINSMFLFKRIPTQVWFDRALLPAMRGEYGDIAKFFTQQIAFTAMRLAVKYVAMGYVPDPTKWGFWKELLVQNAIVPPFLQPLFSADRIDRFNVANVLGRTMTGGYSPLIDLGQLVKDSFEAPFQGFTDDTKHRLAKDTHRVIKDFAPLKSHPLLALAYERLLFDNIILLGDPEAVKTLAKAEEYRVNSGKSKLF